MTFKFQNYNPVVSIATGSNISDNSPVLEADRCSLEEHFPGVELIPRQGSCAVVGNSGILNNSSCGDFIDSHDFVIRANMGLIKGYEVDVGRTSDLNAFNRATLLKYGHAIRAAKKSVERDRFLEHVRTLKESILWYPKSLTKLGGIHRSSVNYRSVINETRKNGLSGIRFAFNWKPIRVEKAWGLRRIATLGLDMYAVARTFCANINLFGFYPFYKDLEGRDIKYHYFDDVKFNYSLNRAHSWDLEHRKLKELERQGKLTLIVRDCKPRKQIPV
ncbi:CMP-N-acetylneuraminate-poly-alpha-2,8-sialyltransferase-like [Acanthaster planci]|uniref:CMP-N-acetylneuraminate-poly-alpha-2, 8-sialyltransferase-like n=1 Tax=Acanthaster planci TaxID=133434 RepID=A0A8B7ZKW0_ACAPL|nr:CMP-N-acetylneuraminate-poly-alpha-2,8-sialyltransferase-like [Acanthaster planci]